MKKLLLLLLSIFLLSCSQEKWSCFVDGKDMWSVSENGGIGPANYGCSCDDIRNHAIKNWGYVDEEAMKSDFGCYF